AAPTPGVGASPQVRGSHGRKCRVPPSCRGGLIAAPSGHHPGGGIAGSARIVRHCVIGAGAGAPATAKGPRRTMLATMLPAAVAAEQGPKLPASPAAIGLAALAFFGVLLAITYAFRNVARKQ